MRHHRAEVLIHSRDYWFKIVDFLQQNWALIDVDDQTASCVVFFFGDTSGVFDRMSFQTLAAAEGGLRVNGFTRFDEDSEAQGFIGKPPPPFYEESHPNDRIYSSGEYWLNV